MRLNKFKFLTTLLVVYVTSTELAFTAEYKDDEITQQKFRPAIEMLPDSISFVSYVCRSCYEDAHAGNAHLSVAYKRTEFSWKNPALIQESCTRWYFHEIYNGIADQVGEIVYRPAARQLVIGFRGTVYHKDWGKNLQATTEPYSGVLVHSGFINRYQSIISFPDREGKNHSDSMLKNIRQVIDSERIDLTQVQVVFTGHSAGAALATLAAFTLKGEKGALYDFNKLVNNQVCLVTFSSPRVGNRSFATELEKRLGIVNVLRFICLSDTVPYVPFENLGYKHAGIEIPVTTAEKILDSAKKPTDTFDYFRPLWRLANLLNYPKTIVQNGISSMLLPLSGSSILLMHSMPSDQLVIKALSFAKNNYDAKDRDVRKVGQIPWVSPRRPLYML